MSKGEPMEQSTTFLISFTQSIFSHNVVELVTTWSGKSMGRNSNWVEDPFVISQNKFILKVGRMFLCNERYEYH